MEPTNGEPVVKKPATKEPTGRGTCSQACNQGAFSPGVTQSARKIRVRCTLMVP